MIIIADKRIPAEALQNLRNYGELVLFETTGITEESISCHPDIFFCKTPQSLIIAPNLPLKYKTILAEKNIAFIEGDSIAGMEYHGAARYNAVVTETHLIHRTDITDTAILNNCPDLDKINVRQGFTRCSLLPLKENNFITSDEGIYKTLNKPGFRVMLVSAKNIILHGHKNGFFGGACGVAGNTVFITGNLNHFPDGEKVKQFILKMGYDIVELYDGPLFDCGSLLFL